MELADISGGGGVWEEIHISSEFLEDFYHPKRKDLENERCLQAYILPGSIFLSIMLHNNILCTYVDVYPCKFYYDK